MHSAKSPNISAGVRCVSPAQAVTTPIRAIAAIGKLSDDAILNIFRCYIDTSPRCWLRLAHVCRMWRRNLFASQRDLQLRLFCTHGAPVRKILNLWPTLPIVVEYGGTLALDPPAPKEEDDIIAALTLSHRVTSISLTITSSLLERLCWIKNPFLELEDLVLLTGYSIRLSLPSYFQWGPNLRCLHLTGITSPVLLQLLHSSRNLVDLQLHEVLQSQDFSPGTVAEALSGMTKLQSLSFHFSSTTYYLNPPPPPPFRGRVVLPVLTRLNFRGVLEYLDDFVARINAPRLEDIDVTFFDGIIMISKIPELSAFINRIEMHKSHHWAHVLFSEHAISISLMQPGAPTRLKFQLYCHSLNEQLYSMTQICINFSAFLFNVEDLRISSMPTLSYSLDELWSELINVFKGAKWFHLDGHYNTTRNIVRALKLPNRLRETVLPALLKLHVSQPGPLHWRLSRDITSCMALRRLSGYPITVEYEHISERGTGPFSQQVTIDMLSDDVLFILFRHYLGATPRIWPALACVCQRWRQIIFTSPLGLDLRVYCTYRMPVLKNLDCWPALPIVLQYGGVPNLDPPGPEDYDNVIAALKQSDRVSAIGLTIPNSLIEKLSAISEPLSELKELSLLSQDDLPLTLPNTFRWGPHLRTLHSTRIAFSSFPQLLSPSKELVYLQLHEIPRGGYFHPEAFANALSGMTQLQTLSLHFLSLPPRRNFITLPPPRGDRVVLPSLTCVKYRGTSKYLDTLVARIDAPRLEDIDITFFSQPTMDASQLGRFIDRIEILQSPSGANIQTSTETISISFTGPFNSRFQLQISCKQLDWQSSCMAQVCDQFSPFLSRVTNLGIDTTQSSSGQDDVDGGQWLELVRSFGGATDFWLAGELVTEILRALGPTDGRSKTVLPSLLQLHVEEPMAMDGPSWDAVRLFIASRWLSGNPVQLHARGLSCHICHSGFTDEGLKYHLLSVHGYRMVCSYCGDFECTPGHNHLFREHLGSKHPEIARNDALISDPFLSLFPPSQLHGLLDNLVYRHSFPRAPGHLHHDHGAAALPMAMDSVIQPDPSMG